MTDVIIEIMVEVLTVLAIATKEMKSGRISELISCRSIDLLAQIYSEKYLKKIIGNRDVEDSLQRLDKLTQEEARMASAELLKITHSVEDTIQDVDDKLDQVNRSSSPNLTTPHSEALLSSQGISSEIIFYDGFRLQIHQSIIILHPKLVTMVQLSGSFEAEYLRTGNPLAPCGCTENVRPSQLLLRHNS
jgi:hypothetical protein